MSCFKCLDTFHSLKVCNNQFQINAYYKKCSSTVLCNCGVAARSGNSLFVANFCSTKAPSDSRRRVNRYVINRLCDDQNLIVTDIGNTYKVI